MNGNNHAGSDIYYLGVPNFNESKIQNQRVKRHWWMKWMYVFNIPRTSGRSDIMFVCKKHDHEVPMTFLGWHIYDF